MKAVKQLRRAQWQQKSRFQKFAWWFERVWLGLVLAINLAAIAGSFIGVSLVEGATKVQKMYDPFSGGMGTIIINAVLLAPVVGVRAIADRRRASQPVKN